MQIPSASPMVVVAGPVVLVLAGGKGRRIGGDKPRRKLAGMPLIDHALSQALRWTDSPVVAVRSDTQLDRLDARIIEDDPAIEGPLGGLAAGLRHARRIGATRLLTIPADMPFLPHDFADRLGIALDTADCGAALAKSGGHLHPVCALWNIGVEDALPDYLAMGTRSLRGFAETVGFVAAEWGAGHDESFFNINDPDGLARAQALLRN